MATFNKFQDFVEQLCKGVHDLDTDTLKVALTNTIPTSGQTILANITQIANGGGYTAGGYTLDTNVVTETGGTATLDIADEVITATTGGVASFRYLVIYNDTATSPADALIGWFDYGSSIALADTETFTITFDAAGLLTVA